MSHACQFSFLGRREVGKRLAAFLVEYVALIVGLAYKGISAGCLVGLGAE